MRPSHAVRLLASLLIVRSWLDKLTYHRVTQYLFFKQWLSIVPMLMNTTSRCLEICQFMWQLTVLDRAQPHFLRQMPLASQLVQAARQMNFQKLASFSNLS